MRREDEFRNDGGAKAPLFFGRNKAIVVELISSEESPVEQQSKHKSEQCHAEMTFRKSW